MMCSFVLGYLAPVDQLGETYIKAVWVNEPEIPVAPSFPLQWLDDSLSL
jgi:hypothetical protein